MSLRLYAAAVAQILEGTPAGLWSCDRVEDAIPAFVAAYLSQAHLDNREKCCSLMALPSDVARSGEPVRRAYRQVFEHMVGNLERGLSGSEQRRQALAVAALCIGGMAAARAVDDEKLANELREAAKATAFSIAGWTMPRVEAAE